MKLTNSDRQAFIAAVMNDVPSIDYDEQAQKICESYVRATLPPTIARLSFDPMMREHLKENWIGAPSPFSTYSYRGGVIKFDVWKKSAAYKQLLDLRDLATEQALKHGQLSSKLYGLIYSCNTLKQAKAMLPEFEKYLPEDRDTKMDRSLPAISGLVADLVKAGWPK